ncbi:SUMF1/EgtB/PvdO family nonheme iron enzyme, partial [bacterium]|nr:SUMF1/EgtB/PvdO family nonheme iron enzyme [bacterium]
MALGCASNTELVISRVAGKNYLTRYTFENNRPYRLRIRVVDLRVEIWLDHERVWGSPREGRVTFRKGTSYYAPTPPLGIATVGSASAIRSVRLRTLQTAAQHRALAAPWDIYTQWPFDATEARRRQAATAKALGVRVERDIDLGNGVKMRMVLIPAGEFMMGSKLSPKEVHRRWPDGNVDLYRAEHPRHRVRLSKPFYMGRCEVTRSQFAAFVGETHYRTSAEKGGPVLVFRDGALRQSKGLSWRRPGFDQSASHPVVCVSWLDAKAFCNWLSHKAALPVRLPTEAERENACRAGSDGIWPWGDQESSVPRMANVADEGSGCTPGFKGITDGYAYTAPVGQYGPNAFGLCDMIGNVWEWCSGCLVSTYDGAPLPFIPAGPSAPSMRVVRGGSWGNISGCRCAMRNAGMQSATAPAFGFRVVIEAPSEPARVPPKPETARAATTQAVEAYADQSDKVWALFRERKYDDAGKLIGQLAARPELKPAANRIQADREALALLREFWAAAAKGATLLQGKSVVIGGMAGTVEAAKDGEITLRTAGAGLRQVSVQGLATPQAVLAADALLRDDARAALLRGVFLLAERTELDQAKKALDQAGDTPTVAILRERLDTIGMGSQQVAARIAWRRIQDAARRTLTRASAKRIRAMLAEMEKRHGQTAYYRSLGESIDTLTARIAGAAVSKDHTEWPLGATEARRRQLATARALSVKVEREVEIARGVTMRLVLIPSGTFMMGSPATEKGRSIDETPDRVTISRPFWMGKFEVTQKQWVAVMGSNPSEFEGPKNPVERVSWNHVQAFLSKVNAHVRRERFALPTEAQWEYACRAGTSTAYCFGDRATDLNRFAWHGGNSDRRTHAVGQFLPNAWGIHDLHGNVWEWCAD